MNELDIEGVILLAQPKQWLYMGVGLVGYVKQVLKKCLYISILNHTKFQFKILQKNKTSHKKAFMRVNILEFYFLRVVVQQLSMLASFFGGISSFLEITYIFTLVI